MMNRCHPSGPQRPVRPWLDAQARRDCVDVERVGSNRLARRHPHRNRHRLPATTAADALHTDHTSWLPAAVCSGKRHRSPAPWREERPGSSARLRPEALRVLRLRPESQPEGTLSVRRSSAPKGMHRDGLFEQRARFGGAQPSSWLSPGWGQEPINGGGAHWQ